MCRKLIYLISFVLVLGVAGNTSAGLVAHWPLDGDAADLSGNGHDGTPNGDPAFVPGRFDQALEFTGSPQYVNCGTGVSFTTVGDGGTTEGYTISVWINPYNPGGDGKICGDLDDPGWGAAGGFKLALYQTRIESDVRDSSGRFFSREATEPDGLALEENTWYHVAVVYDDAGDTYTEYINGEVSRSVSVTQGVAASTADFRIGTDTPNLGHYFNGLLDDLRIYDSALTETEILGVMQGGGVSYPFALGPVPKDTALHEDTWVNLSWRPGDSAVSHDVYLGDNFDDVNSGAEDTIQGNQGDTFFVAGFPGFPYP
ncbi:MAG: LamG domain-containing protein, partial [Planctomycetes bacterium]|nr:LamG domain-containing protein [Planctomycetota bacterium]